MDSKNSDEFSLAWILNRYLVPAVLLPSISVPLLGLLGINGDFSDLIFAAGIPVEVLICLHFYFRNRAFVNTNNFLQLFLVSTGMVAFGGAAGAIFLIALFLAYFIYLPAPFQIPAALVPVVLILFGSIGLFVVPAIWERITKRRLGPPGKFFVRVLGFLVSLVACMILTLSAVVLLTGQLPLPSG